MLKPNAKAIPKGKTIGLKSAVLKPKVPRTKVMPTAHEKAGVHILQGSRDNITMSATELQKALSAAIAAGASQAQLPPSGVTGETNVKVKAAASDPVKASTPLDIALTNLESEIFYQLEIIRSLENRLEPIMYAQNTESDVGASSSESSSPLVSHLDRCTQRIRGNREYIESLIGRLPTN